MKKFCTILALTALTTLALAGENRAYLGVYLEHLGHDGEAGKGVLVKGVVDDSAAAKAGLQADDVIVKVNGVNVTSPKELIHVLNGYQPDEEVSLEVVTGGKEKNVVVVLGERPKVHVRVQPHKWLSIHESRPYIGIQMEELNPQLAAFFKVSNGILITKVEEDSPAEKAGLMAGDIIQNWQGSPVENIGGLFELLAEAKESDLVELTVKRHDEYLDLPVTLGASKDGFQWRHDFNFKLAPHMEHLEKLAPKIHLELKDKKIIHQEMKELKEELDSLREQLKDKHEN